MRFTEKQQEAIFLRDTDILVSAAAGSGKTSVLSERAAQLVLEGEDIRRMLICTFTNAAAAEMRQRIVARLSELAEEKDDMRLRTQAEYAAFSDISTIHSFAQKIIRENTLLSENRTMTRSLGNEEMMLVRNYAMEEAFEELYTEENADFLSLRGKYAERNDNSLSAILFSLYDYVNSLPERMDFLREASEKSFDYAEVLKKEREVCAARALALMDAAIELDRKNGWDKQLEKDIADRTLLAAIKKHADDAEITKRNAEEFKLSRLTSKLSPEEDKELLKSYRESIKDSINELADYSPQLPASESEYMRRETAAFLTVLLRFEEKYMAKKAARNAMDFDDMMHFANELLKNELVAEEYRGRYDHIFVDEYQDTNPIQEELLSRIAKPGGKFMVGDIKQSIYRFRLADPMIFSGKVDAFEKGTAEARLIRMNENFRSLPAVTAPLNHIMRRLMSRDFGEIDYDEREELIPMRENDENGGMELMLTLDLEGEKAEAEFSNIADRIFSLYGKTLNGKTLSWGDFCVLFRGGKEKTIPALTDYLEKAGIPVGKTPSKQAMSPMLIFINILKLIDGFYSDIALISVMRSHIGVFDEAELAQIRMVDVSGSFRTAFMKYKEGTDVLAEKCRLFYARIEKWRVYAKALGIADFLSYLKTETQFLASLETLPDGEMAAARFDAFFTGCLETAGSVRSLAELAERLEEIHLSSGALPLFEHEEEKQDSVSIMTVHKSKGLQFPVVILASTEKGFNDDDLRKRVIWHKRTGLAMDIIDENAHLTESSACKSIVANIKKFESRSEELRILYVAMTRAESLLIISGRIKSEESLEKMMMPVADAYAYLRAGNILTWIVNAAADMRAFGGTAADADIRLNICPPKQIETREEQAKQEIEELLRSAYTKPAAEFIRYDKPSVPSWVGVSWLLPEYEAIEGDYAGDFTARKGDTGAAFGTLVHLFMERAPETLRTKADVISQVGILREKEIISRDEAAQLIRNAGFIANFFESELAERIRKAKRIYRELPFCVAVDAEYLGYEAPGEKILVGGIIDMIFEEEDGLVIVDYKSNHASPDTIFTLAEHYHKQMEMYTFAVSEIWQRPVKEKYLFFLRPGIALSVD